MSNHPTDRHCSQDQLFSQQECYARCYQNSFHPEIHYRPGCAICHRLVCSITNTNTNTNASADDCNSHPHRTIRRVPTKRQRQRRHRKAFLLATTTFQRWMVLALYLYLVFVIALDTTTQTVTGFWSCHSVRAFAFAFTFTSTRSTSTKAAAAAATTIRARGTMDFQHHAHKSPLHHHQQQQQQLRVMQQPPPLYNNLRRQHQQTNTKLEMAAVFVETIAAETVAATAAAAEYASPLRVSDLADYAPAATSLFNNMKLPAAVVTAGMISLGFATGFPELPRETPDNKHIFTPRIRKRCEALKRLHIVVALIAVTSELIVVMWAAVEVNQLTEKRYALAASVWDLIQRDCDLAWSAVNSHFVLGIIGFVAMLTLRAYVMLLAAEASNALLTAAGAGTGAALCLMISIVNRGVESGGGNGERYGSTIVDLLQHYVVLLFREATQEISPGPLQLAAIVLESISLVYMANVLVFQNGKAENPPPSLLLLQADETQPQDEECNNNNNNDNSPPVTVLEWFDATSPGSSTNTNSSGGSDPKEGNNKNKKKKVLVMVDVDGSNNNINNNTTLKNSNSETSISDANDQPGSKKAGRPLTLEERKTLAECLDLKDERNDQPDGEEGNDDEDDEEEQRRMDSGDFPSVTVL